MMEMKMFWLVLVFSISLVEATGCEPTTSPECFKNSTGQEEDFTCKWKDGNTEQNPTYTLYILDSAMKRFALQSNTNQTEKYLLLEQLGTISRNMEIWVQRRVGNLTCNSTKIKVIFKCLAKYSKPEIINMTRSAGILNLTLSKTKDNKSVIYEVRWRERGAEWQNETFETEDNTFQDFYTLRLQKQTVYQVQLRRQAKPLLPKCDSQQVLWSDWSIPVDIPIEIRHPPKVRWKETQNNHNRDLHLTWDAPSADESVGGVTYKLNVSVWPCDEPKMLKPVTVKRTLQTSITLSETSVSIIAVNRVGSSPPQLIIIPAVKHLNYCTNHQIMNTTKAKKTCLEWYRLADGKTRSPSVNTSREKSFKDIEKEVEQFVRHYYFLHTKTRKLQTVALCPFYSQEGVPSDGPDNVVLSNVTHESAVVSWLSIPVENQRGFLQQYLIWITEKDNTTHYQLPANETSFVINNLQPGASYTVSIAGRTNAGKGPNSTANFETPSVRTAGLSWQNQTILSVCVIALLCTFFCPVTARRFRSKLLPVVPRPVIPKTGSSFPPGQDLNQLTEEVHKVDLLQLEQINQARKHTTPEECTLLQDIGLVVFEEEEEEEEITELNSRKSCCYPNPSYRGQMLCLPESIHMTENIYKENDAESTYRNGLFFETRLPECDKTTL